jgi:protease-4
VSPPPTMHKTVPNMTPNPMHPMQTPQMMPQPMMPHQPMMPQMMPMPFPYPQQQPPPRSGGAGKAIFIAMLELLLIFSRQLNLVLIAGSFGRNAAGITQQTLQAGAGTDKIAVVPLRGIIDTNMSAQFDRFMDLAEGDKNVKAVVVEIDSPGGTVTASDEIYHRIRKFKSKKSIPVVVSMGSLATSGGYYAACGADHVFAQPTTFTGNIGVLLPRYNFSKLMEKYGVEETTIVSTGATFKNAGSSFRPESPAEKQYMQELADAAFAQFKDVVSTGRSSKLKANLEDVANGKVFTAKSAKDLGLIDDVGYLEDAQGYAQSQAGLTNPTIVRYQNPPSLMQLLMASGSTVGELIAGGGEGAPSVSITVDQKLLHELSTPRPMYLWRGQ